MIGDELEIAHGMKVLDHVILPPPLGLKPDGMLCGLRTPSFISLPFPNTSSYNAYFHPRWPPIVYFLVFGAQGATDPFLPYFYESHGFTATEAGAFTMINRTMGFIAGPFWGALADVTHQHQKVLQFTLATSTIGESSGGGRWWWVVENRWEYML